MADLPHKDNPAGRLYLLLEKVRKEGGQTPFIEAWRNVLNVPGTDQPKLLSRMGSVHKLPLQIRDLLPNIPALASNPRIAPALDKIVGVLNKYYSGNVGNSMKAIGQAETDALINVSSTVTHTPFAEPIIEDEFLEKVRSDVAALFNDVQESDLDDAEKTHLLNLLDVLSNAVVVVEIGGGSALRSAADEVIGSVVFDTIFSGQNPWRTAVGNLALSIASRIATGMATDKLAAVDDFFGQLGVG